MAESETSPLLIDRARVRVACQQEWEVFVAASALRPIPEGQDQRAFFLNWVAEFMPEAFPQDLIPGMWSFVENALSDSDPFAWCRPLLIETTLFALTGGWNSHQTHVSYFDYGGSFDRAFLHQTLALVAPALCFDAELTARLERCLSIPFLHMDYGLALYGVSQGSRDVKLANLKRWREAFFMNTSEAEIVDRFLEKQLAHNPLVGYLLRNTSYVTLRIGCEQTGLGTDDSLDLRYSLSDVWTRVANHPLYASYIELRGD
jgi:hypothetical protein